MKKIALALTALVLTLAACEGQDSDSAHNARNSLDWTGVYTGTIPAADGPGIEVRLTLNPDESYFIEYHYLDKHDSTFTSSGAFNWDDTNRTIILDTPDLPPYYQVGENTLTQLDIAGNPILGKRADYYILHKIPEF